MGGNVFTGSKAIKKENIEPTLSRFFQEIQRIFPGKAGKAIADASWLGSTGVKDESGDIDLAVSSELLHSPGSWGISKTDFAGVYEQVKKRARTATKEQLILRAMLTLIGQKIDISTGKISVGLKGVNNGTLFAQFPQFDKKGNFLGYPVQIDLNFGDIEWLKFAYHSGKSKESNVKGLHRTQLMIALFTNKGYTFSHNYGVKNKETGKLVADSPKKALEILNKAYEFEISEDDLDTYSSLQKFLKKHLEPEVLNKVWDIYLGVLDHTRCDIPSDLENYWLDNQERLDLTGKFLPTSSKLYPFRED